MRYVILTALLLMVPFTAAAAGGDEGGFSSGGQSGSDARLPGPGAWAYLSWLLTSHGAGLKVALGRCRSEPHQGRGNPASGAQEVAASGRGGRRVPPLQQRQRRHQLHQADRHAGRDRGTRGASGACRSHDSGGSSEKLDRIHGRAAAFAA